MFGAVAKATDLFILPLTYEEYNEIYVPLYTGLPTISEVVGGMNPPHGANGM